MKKILLSGAVLLLSLSAFAQNCTKILKTETYGSTVMTSMKEPIKVTQGSDGIEINLIFGSNLIFKVGTANRALKCVGSNALMNTIFTDGSKSSLTHMGKLNCEGNFSVFFGEVFQNTNELQQLETKKIKTIGITYSDYKDNKRVDNIEVFSLTDDQSTMVMQTLKCLSILKN